MIKRIIEIIYMVVDYFELGLKDHPCRLSIEKLD